MKQLKDIPVTVGDMKNIWTGVEQLIKKPADEQKNISLLVRSEMQSDPKRRFKLLTKVKGKKEVVTFETLSCDGSGPVLWPYNRQKYGRIQGSTRAFKLCEKEYDINGTKIRYRYLKLILAVDIPKKNQPDNDPGAWADDILPKEEKDG